MIRHVPDTLTWGGTRQTKWGHRGVRHRVLLYRTILTANLVTFDFYPPPSFENLIFMFYHRGDSGGSAESLRVYINGNNVYYFSRALQTESHSVNSYSTNNNLCIASPGPDSPAGHFGVSMITLNGYSRSGFAHQALGGSRFTRYAGGDTVHSFRNNNFRTTSGFSNTTPVTRFRVYTAETVGYIPGSIIEVWGHR